jgi:hypothetical protein
LLEGLIALREVEYGAAFGPGDVPERRARVIHHVLEITESRCGLTPAADDSVRDRIRAIRIHTYNEFFRSGTRPAEKELLRGDARAADVAQELLSFPDHYLDPDHATDSRVVETVQRLQESLLGKAKYTTPLQAVIEFGEAIRVPAEKVPRGQNDPLLDQIHDRLHQMLDPLTGRSRPFRR